ncbi:hypothetical protein B0H34DRAFT_681694 [Crassisporium funariophilum]|nr:hypothetical protein B0H34DRAFT_681694 [Crassisporium funariophilum]
MPDVRCRYFDNDGNIIEPGCPNRRNCGFVHPGKPGWAHARLNRNINPDNASRNPPSRGHSRRSSGSRSATSGEWGDTSAWGPTTSSNQTKLPETLKWGSKSEASAAVPSTSGWGASDNLPESSKKGETSTWGGGSDSLEWGKNTVDTWGIGGDTSTSSGWGNITGGWNVASGGWGDHVGGNSGWGNSSDLKGKGKEKEDVQMRDPSPPRAPPPPKPVDEYPRRLPRRPTPPKMQPLSPVTTMPPPPLPLPTAKQERRLPSSGNLVKAAVELSAIKTAKETGNIILGVPNSTRPPLPTKQYRGPKGRADLFAATLKHMQELVPLQLDLQRLMAEVDRWKRTQASVTYARSSPATQLILNSHRAKLSQKLHEAKRQRNAALAALIELPDISAAGRKAPTPTLTKETVAAYTAELRDWFRELELHKRILLEKEAEKETAQQQASQSAASPPVETHLTAAALHDRGTWTWTEIQEAAALLETRVRQTAEQVYAEVYTSFDDLEELVGNLKDFSKVDLAPRKQRVEAAEGLSRRLNAVGDNLGAQAVRTAELLAKLHDLEQERDLVKAEKEKMQNFCVQAESQFEVFEQWKQADMAKIVEMTEQLQKLHLRRRSSQTATPPTIKIDDILAQVRPVILDRLQREVMPIFGKLQERCQESQQGLQEEIEEMLKPALVLTDAICKKVSEMNFATS